MENRVKKESDRCKTPICDLVDLKPSPGQKFETIGVCKRLDQVQQ